VDVDVGYFKKHSPANKIDSILATA